MKKVQIQLKIVNLEDNISVSQSEEGGIPNVIENNQEPNKFIINGKSDNEIIRKIFVSLLGCYCKSVNPEDEWIDDLVKKYNISKEII